MNSTWRRLRAVLGLLGSTIVLLATTVGIPAGLAWSVGTPWPTPVTSLTDLADRLTQPISDTFVIKTLGLIGWVCWGAYMVSLIREAYWAARQLPTLLRDATALRTHLHRLPAHRVAAATLVAAIVFALAAMWRPATARATTAGPGLPRPPAISLTIHAAGGTGRAPQTPPTATPSTAAHAAYTVEPGDTLWDIAKQHLGDPLRWPLIYQLNCHRTQPDGHRLHDPDRLTPGWILHLPAPATEAPFPTATATPHPAASPAAPAATGPVAPAPLPHPAAPAAPAPPHRGTPAPETENRPAPHTPARTPAHRDTRHGLRIDVGPASAIGITTAAGIAAAVVFARAHARRRAEPDLTATPQPLAPAVRAARAAHLNARHATTVAAQHRFVDDEELGEVLVERPYPAQPATAGTVVCAERGGHELGIDLLAVPGGTALAGPGADAAARALAISALSAAERLRPAPAPVRLIIPAATAGRLLGDAADQRPVPAWAAPSDLAAALNLIDQSLLHRARLAETGAPHGPVDPETGLSIEGDRLPMDLLICDPDPQHTARLATVARHAMPGQLAVVVVNPGTWPAQVRLAEDGAVVETTGPTAQPLLGARMFTLARGPAGELLDVLQSAYGTSIAHPAPQTSSPQPHPKPPTTAPLQRPPQPRAMEATPCPQPDDHRVPEAPDAPESKRHDADAPDAKRDDADAPPPIPPPAPGPQPPSGREQSKGASPVPITVDVLGRFRIRAAGKDKEFGHGMREETREFLALLAAHPKGIRSERISDVLQLSSDPEQAARELGNLRRAVRRSLRQATGAQQAAFIVRAGDRDILDRNLIATDFAVFTDAMQRSRQTRDQQVRAASLKEAIAAYGGPLCEGADYPWADEMRDALHRQAVDALMLLADLEAKAQPHPDPVLALLEQAAEWDRHNETIYQRIIRLQLDAGRDDAAHRTYALLKRRLAEIGVAPDPATNALISRQQRRPVPARR